MSGLERPKAMRKVLPTRRRRASSVHMEKHRRTQDHQEAGRAFVEERMSIFVAMIE